MRIPKRGEMGFTLIELLIVVAILGVLAAVVIPNVGRFIGRGEEEAGATEFANLQTAVVAMMVDNQLSTLPNPVLDADAGTAGIQGTSNMRAYPDATSDSTDGDDPGTDLDKITGPEGGTYTFGAGEDLPGYILFQHDITGDSANTSLVNYVATQTTKGTYTVTVDGTVNQETTGYE